MARRMSIRRSNAYLDARFGNNREVINIDLTQDEENAEAACKSESQEEYENKIFSDLLGASQCAICLEIPVEALVLGCGHSFCGTCVTIHMHTKTLQGNLALCPTCNGFIASCVPNFALRDIIKALYAGSKNPKRIAERNKLVAEAWIKREDQGNPVLLPVPNVEMENGENLEDIDRDQDTE